MASSSTATALLLNHRAKRGIRAAGFLFVPAVVAVVLCLVPFSAPMSGFWSDAQEFAGTGHIQTVFTPCGYPALIGVAYRIGGLAGVVGLQLLVFAAVLVTGYAILRQLRLNQMTALAGSAVLALHPDLVISVKKVWDTDLTALLLMLLCLLLLVVVREGVTVARAATIAFVWGLSITVRPNFPALLLPIVLALWRASSRAKRWRTLAWSAAIVLPGAMITAAAVNTAVHGSFFVPQNGPYNFYAGDNPYTAEALLNSLNAEPSIYPSMVAQGFPRNIDVYDPALRSWYARQAMQFIWQNPYTGWKLVLLKLATLLRPDTKIYPLLSLQGAVKAIEALAVPVWLLSLGMARRTPWRAENWLFVIFVIAYLLPFLLTNADPRFRIPLDILVLTHAVSRFAAMYREAIAQPGNLAEEV